MKPQLTLIAVLVIALALAGCVAPVVPPTPTQPPAPTPTSPPPPPPTQVALTPADVVMGWAERLNAGDVDGALALWADDGIWYFFGLPPNGSELLKGKEALRTEFANEIADNLNVQFEIKSVVGDVVTSHDTTWMDFTRQIGAAPMEATGQFLIEDGKIVEYTWTPTQDSVTRLMTALAEVMPPEPEAAAPVLEAVSELTVTFADGTCSIPEPVALKAGDVQVTVNVQDENKQAYAVTFLTLDEGKTFMDLMASTTGLPPAWSNLLHYEEIGPASTKTYTVSVDEGPLYAICWARPPDHPIGNLGPFEVVAAVEEAAPAEAEPVVDIPPSDLVVTFADGKCTLNSPLDLKAGENTVTMVVEESGHPMVAFVLLNLDAGRGRKDAPSFFTAPVVPRWAHEIAAHDAVPGDVKTYSITLEAKPLYVACIGVEPDKVLGSFGPIEVSQ